MDLPEFRRYFLQNIYVNVYTRLKDNYDYLRFSYDGVDRSKTVNVAGHAQYLEFLLDHLEDFHRAYQMLADDDSRELYLTLIKYRLLGHLHIRIADTMTWTFAKSLYDKACTYDKGLSSIPFQGLLGPLRHHENIPAGKRYVKLDAWSLNVVYGLGHGSHRQYYYSRNGVRIAPELDDYVLDGGACFGDTAVFFASSVGKNGKVFAFDPLPAHAAIARFNAEQNQLSDQITVTQAGIGEVSNHIEQTADTLVNTASPAFSLIGREDMVPIVSIDDFVQQQALQKVNFIKMNIEGFELAALKGAAKTIAHYRPKLAISLYHKPQDFFEIPNYLKAQFPFYQLHLDHYTIFAEETVLYAIPTETVAIKQS